MNPVVINYLKKFIKWLGGSFDTSENGSSAKKLTSFAFVVVVFYIHLRFCDYNNAIEFLITDVSVICTLLGVATLDKLQSKKKEGGEDNGNIQS